MEAKQYSMKCQMNLLFFSQHFPALIVGPKFVSFHLVIIFASANATSDLGQLNSPYPEEGLAQYLSLLHENGFTHDELRQMTVRVPEALLL